jgi:hypothetical protein
MSATLKLLVLLICINTFMYLGVRTGLSSVNQPSSWVTNDLFDLLLTDTAAVDAAIVKYEANSSISSGYDLNGTLTTFDPKIGSSISTDTGGFSFLDALRVIWAAVMTLLKIGFVPLVLFTTQGIPPVVALILGLPLGIAWIVCIIILLRGGGAP